MNAQSGRLSRTGAALLALLITLVACTPGQNDTAATPAETHMRWIAALRADDERAARALWFDESEQGARMVHMIVSTIAGYLAPNARTGELIDVDVRAPDASGARTVATSVWRFSRVTWCYQTVLAETPSGWKVQDWGQAGQCPEAR